MSALSLTKNTKVGGQISACVAYRIFSRLPFMEGGSLARTLSRIRSFRSPVETRKRERSYTASASERTFSAR